MLQDIAYFEENPELFDALSDEQKELVFSGQAIEVDGDTDATKTDETANPDDKAAAETSDTPDAGQTEDVQQVVKSKDGKHEIPFSVLEEARQKAAEWEAFAKQQQQLIADLQTAKKADAGTNTTDAQEAVADEYQSDFPEIADDLKPLIQSMIQKGIKEGITALEQQLNQRLAPVEQTVTETIADKLVRDIKAVHPDFEQTIASKEFTDWFTSQPSFVQAAMNEAWGNGNLNDKIELLNSYAASRPKPVEPEKPAAKDVSKIIAETKKPSPNSLTDIPAGKTGPTDEMAAIEDMSPSQLANLFAGKTEAQVNQILSRLS